MCGSIFLENENKFRRLLDALQVLPTLKRPLSRAYQAMFLFGPGGGKNEAILSMDPIIMAADSRASSRKMLIPAR
jgi:hypothetical protein